MSRTGDILDQPPAKEVTEVHHHHHTPLPADLVKLADDIRREVTLKVQSQQIETLHAALPPSNLSFAILYSYWDPSNQGGKKLCIHYNLLGEKRSIEVDVYRYEYRPNPKPRLEQVVAEQLCQAVAEQLCSEFFRGEQNRKTMDDLQTVIRMMIKG